MRGRLALMIMLAAMLMMTACNLSDRQQIGILRFVASSITAGAIDDTPKVKRTAAVSPCAKHRVQHVASRIHYAKSRMHRVLSRVMHFEMFAAERNCPRATTVRRS